MKKLSSDDLKYYIEQHIDTFHRSRLESLKGLKLKNLSIEPLGYKAKEKNEEFNISYSEIINRFTLEFANEYCINGKINWTSLMKYNSGSYKSDKCP